MKTSAKESTPLRPQDAGQHDHRGREWTRGIDGRDEAKKAKGVSVRSGIGDEICTSTAFHQLNSGNRRMASRDRPLLRISFAVALAALMLHLISARAGAAEIDVHLAKFWLPHCQKSDMACIGYLQALLDINNQARGNGTQVEWCAPEIIKLEDIRLIIVRKLKSAPEGLDQPFVTVATNALSAAYPCLDDLDK